MEELVTSLESAIAESLKYLLEVSLTGNPPPLHSNGSQIERTSESKSQNMSKPEHKALQPINETAEAQFFPSLFTWTFEHCCQVVDLTLRILFTKQIETCLSSENKSDELAKLAAKFDSLIDLYSRQLISFQFNKYRKISASTNNSQSTKMSGLSNSGIVINNQQHEKLDLIIKISIYYRTIIKELIGKKCDSLDSPDWTSLVRFYALNQNNQLSVIIKVKIFKKLFLFKF